MYDNGAYQGLMATLRSLSHLQSYLTGVLTDARFIHDFAEWRLLHLVCLWKTTMQAVTTPRADLAFFPHLAEA
jgi:hypothetical protein